MSLSGWINYMNKDCNEITGCNFKKSLFIEYVNKLRSNWVPFMEI